VRARCRSISAMRPPRPGSVLRGTWARTTAHDGRAVVHYDQLGNGRGTHLPDRGADFWTVALFVRELHNLVDALGMSGRHHVLGQSWGGSRPGVRLHATSGAEVARAGRHCRLVSGLRRRGEPVASRSAARRRGDTAAPRGRGDHRRHGVCRGVPSLLCPSRLQARPLARRIGGGVRVDRARPDRLPHDEWAKRVPRHWLDQGLAVQGSAGLDRRADTARLGRYDEATPALQDVLQSAIHGAEWMLFDESSHMPHLEERGRYMHVVGEWLARHE
jgi:L-proline amide hydrolase